MDEILWAKVRHLAINERLGDRAIGRILGIHRDTVLRARLAEQCPKPSRALRGSLLDSYEEPIRAILAQYPKLSGIRILEKLRALGYQGGRTILLERLRELRPHPVVAFLKRESLPGQEAQVDWGSCGSIVHDGAIRPLSVFVMCLSYSRLLYVEFTVSQEMEDFLRCHVNAFAFFGGYPVRLLYDNLKSVVTWRQKRFTRFNPRFLEFAGSYPFEPVPCNPGKGNEKPRAETAIRYVKQNFLAGRSFRDFADVKVQAFHWLEQIANQRVHGTTGELPRVRFERERSCLRPLPAEAPDTRICRSVSVSPQARVHFQANTYSVAPEWVGKDLLLKASVDRVSLYALDRQVASHVRCYGRFRDIEAPEHTEAILEYKRRARPDQLVDRFARLSPQAERFLFGIAQRAEGSPQRHVEKLLELLDLYGKTALLEAVESALRLSAFGAEHVELLLRQKLGGGTARKRRPPLTLSTLPQLTEQMLDEPNFDDFDTLDNLEESDDDSNTLP